MSGHPSWVRDPFVSTSIVLVGFVGAGFGAIFLGWRGIAPALFVPTQVAFFASAGLGGMALIVLGLGLLSGHLARREEAVARREFDDLLRAAAGLVDDLRER